MFNRSFLLGLVTFVLLHATNVIAVEKENIPHQSDVIHFKHVQWGYLNPLRGDKSPRAADLWGNRSHNEPTGMLVKFNQGFASPPHFHNVSYRGIVINGLIHNDDMLADKMWMNTGSFWTQPAGGPHITAANANNNLIFVEIDSGPYLVHPIEKQFDNGERPINIHSANLVWQSSAVSKLVASDKAQISWLWGKPVENHERGFLLKLNAGFKGSILSHKDDVKAVVIKGGVEYNSLEHKDREMLEPGSHFRSVGRFQHNVAAREEAIVYVRTNGDVTIYSSKK